MRMVTIKVVEGAAERFFTLHVQNNTGEIVYMRDHTTGVDQNDTVFDAFEYGLGFALLVDQPVHVEFFELLEAVRHPVEFGAYGLKFGDRLLAEPGRWPSQTEAAQTIR